MMSRRASGPWHSREPLHVFGSDDLEGRTVIVQGARGVGAALAERLASANATVLVADIDPTRAQLVAARIGGAVMPADGVFEAECDVYERAGAHGISTAAAVDVLAEDRLNVS
jgi:leucine dehydrogenase